MDGVPHTDDPEENQVCEQNEGKDEISCPLFMDGLPKNFESNPALAAIASLLDEDGGTATSTQESESAFTKREAIIVPGGGKARFENGCSSRIRRNAPYSTAARRKRTSSAATTSTTTDADIAAASESSTISQGKNSQQQEQQKEQQQKKASVGEAQLFMKMWKLS